MKFMHQINFQALWAPLRSPKGSFPRALLILFFISSPVHASDPIRFVDLEKSGFTKLRWQNLKTEERTAFYRAYAPDKEMLKRTRVGLIDPKLLGECIAGEAPSITEAKRKFPLHYPMLGRIKNTAGTFEWKNKKLIFRTASQQYHVDEYHILHRLERLGFTKKSGARKATVEAIWMVNRFDGLRILYMQSIDLAKTKR